MQGIDPRQPRPQKTAVRKSLARVLQIDVVMKPDSTKNSAPPPGSPGPPGRHGDAQRRPVVEQHHPGGREEAQRRPEVLGAHGPDRPRRSAAWGGLGRRTAGSPGRPSRSSPALAAVMALSGIPVGRAAVLAPTWSRRQGGGDDAPTPAARVVSVKESPPCSARRWQAAVRAGGRRRRRSRQRRAPPSKTTWTIGHALRGKGIARQGGRRRKAQARGPAEVRNAINDPPARATRTAPRPDPAPACLR